MCESSLIQFSFMSLGLFISGCLTSQNIRLDFLHSYEEIRANSIRVCISTYLFAIIFSNILWLRTPQKMFINKKFNVFICGEFISCIAFRNHLFAMFSTCASNGTI